MNENLKQLIDNGDIGVREGLASFNFYYDNTKYGLVVNLETLKALVELLEGKDTSGYNLRYKPNYEPKT
jgi:hypothetical protein